jgi:hypothetical protein
MLLGEIRAMVMHQIGDDLDDLKDYQPYIERYIMDGYDRLNDAYHRKHLADEAVFKPGEYPDLPTWMHVGIADYATYMMYRNGNQSKQNRGVMYYQNFLEIENKARSAKKIRTLKNLYVDKEK